MPVDVRSTLVRVALILAALAAGAAAPAQPVAYVVAHPRSSIHVVTGRAGALAFLGHDHAVLDAGSHPELRFESRTVSVDGSDLVVEGDLALHGVTRTLVVPVRVTREPGGATRFRTEARLRMTDHGIGPESTLGLVDVADAFRLVVDLVARPGTEGCRGDAAVTPRRRGDAP